MSNLYMKKTRRTVVLAIMIALVVALQTLSTLISRATLLPFNITLTMIPIIVGALMFGISAGAVLGFSFGAIVMIYGLTGLDPSCALLIEENIFGFILTCLVKGTAAGAMVGLIGKLLTNHKYFAVFLAAIVAPVTNTGLFLLGMRVFYYDLLLNWAGGQNIIYYMFVVLCGINFLIELGTDLILSPAVVRILEIIQKRQRGYGI